MSNNDYTDYKVRLIYSDTVDKANYSSSPIGKLGGQGDYIEKENYLYRLGETHPLVVHVRQAQAKAKEEQTAQECADNFMDMFFNFDMED